MKKLSVLILVAAALFASCNNLTVEKNKDSKSGNVTINIANQSRTISPMSGVSLSNFEEWTITFEDQSGLIDVDPKTGRGDSFTFTVPAGLYTVTATSSYTPPETADGNAGTELILTGSKTNVEIGDYAEVNISVGLKKENTGNFSYTLTGDVSGYVSLVNIKKGGTGYSAQIQSAKIQDETSDESDLKAVYNYNGEIPEVVVTGTGLKSGFYKLYVTDTPVVGVDNTGAVIYYDTNAVIYYDIGDFLVEIADGLTTTGSASSVSESQTQVVYYGTNETTDYNGKFPFARKNVNDILKLLIDNKKWQFATIYMDTDVPNLDVVVINQLREAMTYGDRSQSGDGYYVNIKGVSVDTLIDLSATKKEASEGEASGGWTSYFKVSLATELSLNADSADKYPDVSKKLVIDNADAGIQTLTLKNGVTVATSSLYGISEKLTVSLDNYNTYEKTAFLVFTDVSEPRVINIDFADKSYIAAQKTESTTDADTGGRLYTISWYARVAYGIEAGVNEVIPEFEIKTEAETGTNAVGKTTIPVAVGSTIKFYTSLVDPDKSYAYTWYFTEGSATLLTTDSEYEFDPFAEDRFNVSDDPITIACVVSDGKGNWRSEVFEFVLTASQSPIILYNNETSDAGSRFTLGLAAFDEITTGQTIGNSLLTTTTVRDFCFDGNANLYVATGGDGSYNIYKYTYSLLSGYSSVYNEVLPNALSEINAISCDTTNGYIFYLSGGTIYVYDPSSGSTPYTLEVSVDKIIADADNLFSQEGSDYSTSITNIAVSNYVLYIAMDVTQTVGERTETAQIIARYTYEKSDESIALTLNGYVAAGASEVFKDESGFAVTVNDMMVQDSKLYVLVSQQEGSFDSLTHRGALLTITDNDGDLSLSTYGANEANYAASALEEDEKTFYAPQKFLAVMPKKLVIADEGYWINDLEYPKNTGNSGFVNRVVTVNLAETVEDYSSEEPVDVGVSFDLPISIGGSGPGEYFINY